ncbi:MAG: hypothetical protein J5779_02340 [Clostridia bacterium]|nr:hypothetical protein [Clostridia bacterium]
MMNYKNLAEVPEKNFDDLTKSIGKQIKVLNKAAKTDKIEEAYSNELLDVLKAGKNNLNDLVFYLNSLSKNSCLNKDVQNSLFDASLREYETLKQNLVNLIFMVAKVQEKEFSYLKKIDYTNKSEINEIITSIKKSIFREFKSNKEFVNNL